MDMTPSTLCTMYLELFSTLLRSDSSTDHRRDLSRHIIGFVDFLHHQTFQVPNMEESVPRIKAVWM